MIREDRINLNQRFVKVFKLLEERGDIIKNDRNGKGMGDFAQKILGNRAYGHIVRAYLNEDDKRCLDYRQARILCREYGVNEPYLLDGIGTPFGFEIPPKVERDDDEPRVGNILFTSTEAFAGATIENNSFTFEDTDYFNIPGLTGNNLVAFPIKGNSMEPVINNGDVVVCKQINGVSEIRDNKIYAVKSRSSIWVKYIQRIPNAKGRVAHLKLISANHLEYDPFVEEVNEYTRIYEVIRRISSL